MHKNHGTGLSSPTKNADFENSNLDASCDLIKHQKFVFFFVLEHSNKSLKISAPKEEQRKYEVLEPFTVVLY